jgi:AbrB family looped-hinge helix DNA binding protein
VGLTNGFTQSKMPNMNVTLDKAGRVVLPKRLRQQLHLAPGDTLELESEGERVTLRPVRPQALLRKEYGVWVYQGEPADLSIPDLIDRERENRLRETLG